MKADTFFSLQAEPQIMVRTLDGEYQFVNDRTCDITKWRKEQYLGGNCRDFATPDALRILDEMQARIVRTGKQEVSTATFTRQDSVEVSIVTRYSLIRSGNADLLHGEAYLIEDAPALVQDGTFVLEDDIALIVDNLSALSRLARRRGLSGP